MQHRGRIEFLDALRGLAALAVVLAHVLAKLIRDGNDWATLPLQMVDLGKFGVILFFMISGFVIPFSFRGSSPLRNFALSRCLRLLPALWLSIASAIMLGIMPPTNSPASTIAANMVMLAQPLGYELISVPYWTLEWELGFYIACAILFATGFLDNTRALGLVALSCAFLALAFPKCAYLGFMFIGSLARQGWWEGSIAARRWTGATVGAISLAILVWCFGNDAPTYPVGFVNASVLALLIFAACLAKRPATPRLLTGLGDASYSIYLFHPQVLLISALLVGKLDSPGSWLTFTVFSLVGSIAVGAVMYLRVERPMIELGRWSMATKAPRTA